MSLGQVGNRGVQVLEYDRVRAAALERLFAGQHFVKHGPSAVNIRASICAEVLSLLRAGVVTVVGCQEVAFVGGTHWNPQIHQQRTLVVAEKDAPWAEQRRWRCAATAESDWLFCDTP